MGTVSETDYGWGDNLRNILATLTATALLYLPVHVESGLLPAEFHEVKSDVAISDLARSLINPYPYYEVSINNELIPSLRVINNFLTKVVKESEELDPAVAKLINKNFWKLV